MSEALDGLVCVPEVGAWLVKRLGLRVEVGIKAGLTTEQEEAQLRGLEPWSGLIESVHLPFGLPRRRLNLAALEETWRKDSLDTLLHTLGWAARLDARKVIIHSAPLRWGGETVGEYGRLVDGVRELAREAERYGILICMENNRTYWDGCDPAAPPEAIDRGEINEYFAVMPEAWVQLVRDVDRPNVWLCLDTSHAVTTAQRVSSLDERLRIMHAFLDAAPWIKHVHWNDNYLMDARGRDDQHLPLNSGSIPIEVHRRVVCLDATRHLERKLSGPALVAEMAFIEALL